MGQNAHRKYKAFKNAQEKLKSYSSNEKKLEVRNLELEYKIQQIRDDAEYTKTDRLFDYINGRD
jgi:hypothetical protein